MGGAGRAPKLPKRSVIERFTKTSSQCLPEMMAFLGCLRDSQFNDSKCTSYIQKLSHCVATQTKSKQTHKPTTFYHLKRLYYMQRR